MSTYDPDDRIEELLRSTLHDEAESVQPAGDGLSRIQQRVGARRARLRWMRPLGVAGSAAALAGIAIGAYALVNGSPKTDRVFVPPATQSPETTSPTPTVTTPVVTERFPARAIFPFTSAAEEANWEGGTDTASVIAADDPDQVALLFASSFLHETSVSTVSDTMLSADGTSATVTLGRKLQVESHKTIDVTEVRLVKFHKAWLVVGAADPAGLLTLTSPKPGTAVSSPIAVTGPGFGVDEAVRVQVFTPHNGTVGDAAHVSFGNGTPQWSTKLGFAAAPEPVGAVVAVDDSPADGLPGRITVVPVRFGSDVALAGYPDRFVGIKDSRVALFASPTGAALSYLTGQQPGGGASDPQVESDTVYFLQGNGTCSNTLMSVAKSGGSTQQVAAPDKGYVISGYAVTIDGTRTAVFETACVGSAQPQGRLVVTDRAGSTSHTVAFPSFPPMIVGDPSWAPDNTHLDAFVRTGNAGTLVRYDAFAAKSWDDSQPACSGYDVNKGLPAAIEVDATGTLWFAVQQGGSTVVWGCGTDGVLHTHIAFDGSSAPQDLDVSVKGDAVLVIDSEGRVWRHTDPDGTARLPTSLPVQQASW